MLDSKYVRISVTPPSSGSEKSGVYKLPVTLGRSRTDSDIVLEDDKHAISRVHAELDFKDGRLQLQDKSLNGTEYRKEHINKVRIALDDTDEFNILGYRIRVTSALDADERATVAQLWFRNRAGERLTDKAGRKFPAVNIGPFFALFLVTENGKIKFEAIPQNADAANLKARINHDRMQTLFAVYANGMVADIRREERLEDIRVYLNDRKDLPGNGLVEPGSVRRVEPLDVISFGEYRLEAMLPGQSALKCTNCDLLNPDDHGRNCQWCGYLLVNSKTIMGGGAS